MWGRALLPKLAEMEIELIEKLDRLTRMIRLMPKLLAVFGSQCVMAWFFYRSRALLHSSWTDSDLVVFGLPVAVGFAVSAVVMFRAAFPKMPTSRRIPAILGLSAGSAVISSFVGTVIGFNLDGT